MTLTETISGVLQARWFAVLIGTVTGVGVAVFFRYLWEEWTLFALIGAGFYLMGTFRLMPWRTPLRKAIAIGMFVGIVLPAVEWLYKLSP